MYTCSLIITPKSSGGSFVAHLGIARCFGLYYIYTIMYICFISSGKERLQRSVLHMREGAAGEELVGLAFKGMSCTPVLVLHGHCGCRSQLAHSFPDLLYTVDSHDDHVCMLQHTEQNSELKVLDSVVQVWMLTCTSTLSRMLRRRSSIWH